MPHLSILTPSATGFYAMHLAGFALHARALRDGLALTSAVRVYGTPEAFPRLLDDAPGELAMVLTDWSWTPQALGEALRAARGRRPGRPILYFDAFDQTSTPYLPLLPEVDLYIKARTLRPPERYLETFAGGYIVADDLHRRRGIDLHGWHFGSTLDAATWARFGHRLVPGWGPAATRYVRHLLRVGAVSSRAPRPIDLHARFSPPPRAAREWYEHQRADAATAVDALRARGHLRITPGGRVGRARYLAEMAASRAVLSPFGWGEFCLRDLEAIALGAVLVKPDMGHLRTSPALFEPWATYAPVRWDLADLPEVLDRVLARDAGARRRAREMAHAARERLRAYVFGDAEGPGFLKDVRRVLDALEACRADGEGAPPVRAGR